MPTNVKTAHPAHPAPDSDFYLVRDALNEQEQALLKQMRSWKRQSVNKYWTADAFPCALLPSTEAMTGHILPRLSRRGPL